MSSTEIAKNFKNLNPGPLDALRGPYPTLAAANLAIPSVVKDGVNYRLGKFVEIGASAPYTTYWWKDGYANENLTEYFADLATKDIVNNAVLSTDKNFVITDEVFFVAENFAETTYPQNWLNTTSTFSGWEMNVGIKNNFSIVGIKLRIRTIPVTRIKVRVFDVVTGSALVEKDLTGLNLAVNTIYDLKIDLGTIITNVDNHNLMVGYMCDQYIDLWGSQGTAPYPYPTYPIAKYQTNGTINFATLKPLTISGAANTNSHINLYSTRKNVQPTPYLLQNIKNNLPEIQNVPRITEVVDNTSRFIDLFIKSGETYPVGGAALIYTTDVFSGWGSPIGTPKNFSCIHGKIKTRDQIVTSVYFELRINDRSGTLISSGTIPVNIPADTLYDVYFPMGATIANSAGDYLWFGYKANKIISAFGVASGTYFPAPPHGRGAYATNGGQTPNTWSLITAPGTVNMWYEIGDLIRRASPTSDFLAEIQRLSPSQSSFVPTAKILIPSMIYATEGVQMNIYFKNVVFSNFPLNGLELDVSCAVGQHMDKYWRYTPSSANVGTTSFTLDVLFNNQVIATKTCTIKTSAFNAGAGSSVKLNAIGDSLTEAGLYLSIIDSDYNPNAKPTVSFIGTRGSGSIKHEGRGGWKYQYSATSGPTYYKFPLSGVTVNPSVGSVYSTNGSGFTIREVNMSAGTGYVSGEITSGGTPPLANGVLTKTSGSGDATLNFTGSSVVPSNPLWNTSASKLDYQNYLTVNSFSMLASDVILITYGTNDFFNILPNQSVLDSTKGYIDAIIAAIRAAVPGINIVLSVTIPPAGNQDAFGKSDNSGQTRDRFRRNMFTWFEYLLNTYDTPAMRSAKTFVLGFNCCIDTDNSFQTVSETIHSRSSTFITLQNNDVHPAPSGYYQMGDALFSFIKSLYA